MYSRVLNNPFLIWGKYRQHIAKRPINVSFQFRHTKMAGVHAARFLDNLQKEIYNIK